MTPINNPFLSEMLEAIKTDSPNREQVYNKWANYNYERLNELTSDLNTAESDLNDLEVKTETKALSKTHLIRESIIIKRRVYDLLTRARELNKLARGVK